MEITLKSATNKLGNIKANLTRIEKELFRLENMDISDKEFSERNKLLRQEQSVLMKQRLYYKKIVENIKKKAKEIAKEKAN